MEREDICGSAGIQMHQVRGGRGSAGTDSKNDGGIRRHIPPPDYCKSTSGMSAKTNRMIAAGLSPASGGFGHVEGIFNNDQTSIERQLFHRHRNGTSAF